MHPLVPAVLLGMAGLDALDLNAQAEPPHRQLAEAVERMRRTQTARRCRSGSPRGRPNSLNARSKTVKAYISLVVDNASQVIRYRLAKSVIVSG